MHVYYGVHVGMMRDSYQFSILLRELYGVTKHMAGPDS